MRYLSDLGLYQYRLTPNVSQIILSIATGVTTNLNLSKKSLAKTQADESPLLSAAGLSPSGSNFGQNENGCRGHSDTVAPAVNLRWDDHSTAHGQEDVERQSVRGLLD